jgi:signal transduction histidine kinase
MSESLLPEGWKHFFPLPLSVSGARSDGSLFAMPDDCRSCATRQCEDSSVRDGIGLCEFGFNYMRLTEEVLAFGFLIAGVSGATQRHRKQLRKYGRTAVLPQQVELLERARDRLLEADRRQAESNATRFVAQALRVSESLDLIIDRLRPEIEGVAGQLHDYIDLAAQILKQLNVYMGSRYPRIAVPDDLDSAPDELQSIYWLARLMEEKISAFGYYQNPESILTESSVFSLHGLVTKYRKMYERACQQRGIDVVMGEDYSRVSGNGEALGIIVHSLLDNAIKYAPSGSTIDIGFDREGVGAPKVTMRMTSLGPRIDPSEESRIFLPFVRGEAARSTEQEGMGFGLAFAQRVAAAYGERIGVTQSSESRHAPAHFVTEFSYRFTLA